MNIAQFCIDRKVLTWTLSLAIFAAGISAYRTIGRLEDPEYTIKTAQIVTYWPGATAAEVASELTDPISHKNALDKAISLVLPLLSDTFGEATKQLTLVCIPASTAEQTAARFEEFAQRVTEATGMTNGYEHITIVADKDGVGDSHLPEYAIDTEFFDGRRVLLFDDIMVTGGSVNKFATRLSELGIDIVAAVVLGKTVAKVERD